MGIQEVLSVPRSPWQRAYVERVIGSIRRECLDHVIVFHERSIRRILDSYFDYYHRSRTHLSLGKFSPEPRPIQPPEIGPVGQCRRSADCTTATNDGLPERAPNLHCCALLLLGSLQSDSELRSFHTCASANSFPRCEQIRELAGPRGWLGGMDIRHRLHRIYVRDSLLGCVGV